MINLIVLTEALQKSWCKETSVAGEELPPNNPARGQCAVSSLVIQDYLGGDIVRVHVTGEGYDENHYFNCLEDGTIVDTTRMQYNGSCVSMADHPKDFSSKAYSTMREWMLSDVDTAHRYELLVGLVTGNMRGDI